MCHRLSPAGNATLPRRNPDVGFIYPAMGVAASLKAPPKRVDDSDITQLAAELVEIWTADQLRQLLAVFRQVSSGAFAVNAAQFSSRCSMLYGLEPVTRERCFQLFDADGNGVVDFKEFAVGVAMAQKGSLEQRSKFVYGLYADAAVGGLTQADLRRLLRDASGRVTSAAVASERYKAFLQAAGDKRQPFRPTVYVNQVSPLPE